MKNINCRYDIIEKLGEGSTGSVYLVQDLMYGRVRRALKIIRAAGMGFDAAMTLRNEFSLLRQFDHPNIVKVYDFGSVVATDSGEHTGDFFFTLDYVQGQDLFQATEHANDEFISSLVFQIAHAIEYIHRHGLIHFDIKPENIIVTEMQLGDETVHIPKITDFGFAAPLLGPLSGSLKGSLHYMAPELISGEKYDHRIDLYSLGVTLYQILTRTVPFNANDAVEVLKKHQMESPASVTELRPDTRPELVELVSALMEKDSHKRMHSARSIVEKMKPIIEHTAVFRNYVVDVLPKRFVGRQEELRGLMDFLKEDVRSIEGATEYEPRKVVCVIGERGIGKTQLLDEWRRQAQTENIFVIGTRCYLRTSPPLEPFRWFMHELKFVLLPRKAKAQEIIAKYDYLFSALAYNATAEKEPKFLFDFSSEEKQLEFLSSFVGLVNEAVAVVPFAISIDDIHLADEMSIQLLRLLTQSRGSCYPLVLSSSDSISTVKKELQVPLHEIEFFVLRGFDEEGVFELIKSQLGASSIPKEVARALSNRVGDSPYIIKEFLSQFRNLLPGVAIIELQRALRDPALSASFPRTINELYSRRFQGFSPEEQYILRIVSCFRTPVNKEILERICPYSSSRLSQLLDLLTMSGALRVFENGNKFHFSHGSFRQFIYQNLHDNKQQLHRFIAEALENLYRDSLGAEPEEIGYHYKEAGMKSKAYEYYFRAAEGAAQAYSLRESNMLLEDAINLASDDLEFKATLEKLARQHDLVEDYEKAETMYSRLLARVDIVLSDKYRYLKALGSVQTRRGLLENAIESFTKASHVAQTSKELMEIEDELADIDISRGRLPEARSRCIKVLESLNGTANDPKISSLFTKLGIISFYETKYDEATEYFLKAYKILERHGDKTKLIAPLLNLGNAYSVRHYYEKALESWSHALRYAEDVGNVHQQGQIHNNLGIAEYNRGHYENALHNYLKGIDIFKRLGNSPGLALCLSNVGEVYLVQSEYEKAFESWEKCLDLYTNINDAHGLAETYCHLSQVFLVFESFDIAREHLRKSRQIIENANLEAQWAIYYLWCGALALAEKKFSEAEQYVLQAKDRFEGIGDDINYCRLLLIGGKLHRQLGRHKESADYFTDALKRSVDLKLPLWEAEALMELGIESRVKNITLEKKTLIYLKEAYELIEHETVNDITWKLCYEIGKEYSSRGLGLKSKEYFVKSKQALLYLGSLYTRQSLQKRFWESDNRGAVLKEIEALIEDE